MHEKNFLQECAQNDGEPRLIAAAPTFQDYVETAFDQIRISGKGNVAIFEQLAEALSFVATCTSDKSGLRVLRKQVTLVAEFADKTMETAYEKEQFAVKHVEARTVF